MFNRGSKKKKKQDYVKKFIKKYKNFCFLLVGRLFSKKKYKKLNEQLTLADLKYTSDVFLSVLLITTIIVTLASIPIYYTFTNLVFAFTNWQLYVIGLTLLNLSMTAVFFQLTVKTKISKRKTQTDQELPFTLSELSVLASTGLTPIKIVRHMARKAGSPIMKNEFRKLVHKIDIEGKDIVSALGEVAKESPSTSFRETLWDISNMIHQGGDLDQYLREKADQTMQLRRDIQQEFIESLGTYSDMYITLVLVSVLFIGIAAFLINAVRSTIGGMDAETLLMLLTYGIIPVSVIVINVIVISAYSKSG